MPPKTRTPEEWISFLMTCMDNTPAKPDWNKIAEDTGAYKSGKFVNQAYVNLRKKYPPLPLLNGEASIPQTPKSGGKKRAAAAADLPEDDEEDTPKKTRKPRTPKKEPAKKGSAKKEQPEEESDEEKVEQVKDESDDELNGDVTVDGEDID